MLGIGISKMVTGEIGIFAIDVHILPIMTLTYLK